MLEKKKPCLVEILTPGIQIKKVLLKRMKCEKSVMHFSVFCINNHSLSNLVLAICSIHFGIAFGTLGIPFSHQKSSMLGSRADF